MALRVASISFSTPRAKESTRLSLAISSQLSSFCADFKRIMDWRSPIVFLAATSSGTFTSIAAIKIASGFARSSRAAVIIRAITRTDGVRAIPLWTVFSAIRRRGAHCDTIPRCPGKPFIFISRQSAEAFRVPSFQRLLSHAASYPTNLVLFGIHRDAEPVRAELTDWAEHRELCARSASAAGGRESPAPHVPRPKPRPNPRRQRSRT